MTTYRIFFMVCIRSFKNHSLPFSKNAKCIPINVHHITSTFFFETASLPENHMFPLCCLSFLLSPFSVFFSSQYPQFCREMYHHHCHSNHHLPNSFSSSSDFLLREKHFKEVLIQLYCS